MNHHFMITLKLNNNRDEKRSRLVIEIKDL
jgi:hypothetical protein